MAAPPAAQAWAAPLIAQVVGQQRTLDKGALPRRGDGWRHASARARAARPARHRAVKATPTHCLPCPAPAPPVFSWPKPLKRSGCRLQSYSLKKLCVPASGQAGAFRAKVLLRTSCGEMHVKYRVQVSSAARPRCGTCAGAPTTAGVAAPLPHNPTPALLPTLQAAARGQPCGGAARRERGRVTCAVC